MYREDVGRVLRLGYLEDEDDESDNNEGGGGEGGHNNDAVNGKKCDKEGREEVGGNHRYGPL